MDVIQLRTHPEPETKQQGPGTWYPVKDAFGSKGFEGTRQTRRDRYYRYRSYHAPRWLLDGAAEVRQAGGAALMGLPWGSTDACNFPLPSHLPLYPGDKTSGMSYAMPASPYLHLHLVYPSLPAFPLPPPTVGCISMLTNHIPHFTLTIPGILPTDTAEVIAEGESEHKVL